MRWFRRSVVPVVAAVLALVPIAAPQLSWGGTPASQRERLPGAVPTLRAESVDVGAYLAEDAQAGKGTPFRFGATLPADLGFEHGAWDLLADGTRVWRLRIESRGAYSLGLLFSQYTLPGGSSLFVYGDGWAGLVGGFDDRNNKEDGEFSIAPVPGDAITLEYVEPAAVAAAGLSARLRVGAVVHDYRDLYALIDGGKVGPGDAAGACEIDVNCPQGASWQEEKRAVTLLIIGGSLCTGALLNNAANDGTQYYISAYHCGALNNAVFRFGFEKSGCGSGTAPTNKTVQGSVQLAGSSSNDFRLVRITSTIPSSYAPYYLGWDRSGVNPSSAVTIHHPGGDVKKISFENNPVTKAGSQWHVSQWDLGVTEGGSSGCPLMTSSGRFIGQLYGGASFCGFPYDDYYGRLDLAWNSVKTWLDPANTGVTTIGGHDPSGAISPPVLSSVSPPTVQAFQGGTLTLSGSNFTGATQVTVGGAPFAPGSFTVVNASTITLPAPDAAALGSTNVTVSNSGGTSAAKSFSFVETDPPKMTTSSFVQGSLPWSWSWGGGANDKAVLIYAIDPTTFNFHGYPVLLNHFIGVFQQLGATGLGGLTVNTPPGSLIVTVHTQIVTLNGGGGFAGASGVASTLVFP
ncbi:MAG TPA: IPT/TIG domain-containing protein [Planctomycetota bacterium]|nr:IPT/TIG domain-containing protein [Planctomycetota bacterium]